MDVSFFFLRADLSEEGQGLLLVDVVWGGFLFFLVLVRGAQADIVVENCWSVFSLTPCVLTVPSLLERERERSLEDEVTEAAECASS